MNLFAQAERSFRSDSDIGEHASSSRERNEPSPKRALQNDLFRLAQFGANITDAHSCFILLPVGLVEHSESAREDLELLGFHSLSNDVQYQSVIPLERGLIGWVARHRRAIHVSPFEQDSRTLGLYRLDQKLKSLYGTPVRVRTQEKTAIGVIACDSKKSFAFSKLQGKLMENLAEEVGNTVALHLRQLQQRGETRQQNNAASWDSFVERAQAVVDALGVASVELLRVSIDGLAELEEQIGVRETLEFASSFERLIQQALPPHLPTLRLPQGDILCLSDTMMGGYYENRIRGVFMNMTQRLPERQTSTLFIHRNALKHRRFRPAPLAQLLAEAARADGESPIRKRGVQHEYR